MCGRFAVTLPPDAMAQLFAATPANDLPDVPNYNVCPTTQIHVIRAGEGQRHLQSMRWGFLPHWYKTPTDGPLLINARAETIAEKPAFRAACRERRCLIPATGFYEWTKDGEGKRLPWYIHRSDGAPLAFAAVWQDWARGEEAFRTCAIVTTGANDRMRQIHHRMPVILEPRDWALWLGEEGKGAATLMRAANEDVLEFYRVDPKVNSNRARGEDLIAPI
ncbi:SOS response-associated peptidase [Primorskyibacter aestuariivivens]|uniref:SOS response-associated peptidase n=1 Tax=Primorskyibacter aestuariivivens TaxID=1888912 RepID=UPI002300C4B0|nr:SOS response-associated peptidase [Primorskyibacter aestuariivivens]MDA7428055.1 SOS response-associated peptidase [Primorskyibacter aestuariivivens]